MTRHALYLAVGDALDAADRARATYQAFQPAKRLRDPVRRLARALALDASLAADTALEQARTAFLASVTSN